MAKERECDGQMAIANYRLPQVEVRLRLAEASPLYSAEPMDCASAAVKAVRQFLRDLDRENVLVVDLDTKLKPVNFSVVSIGSINSSIAPIQNILKTAILSNCCNIMLFHNHPSGSLEPSREDEALTRRLAEACKLMEIGLIDHLIVAGGSGDYFSFREEYPDLFSGPVDLDYIHRVIEGVA